MDCEHKFVHQETIKYAENSGRNSTTYTKIDIYFCEKCLTKEEKKLTHFCFTQDEWKKPDWTKDITSLIPHNYSY